MKHFRTLLVFLPLYAMCPCTVEAQQSQNSESLPTTWYVAAGGSGDGRSPAAPFGSTEEVEKASAPGDIIVVLSRADRLGGGLALKPRQILRGFATNSRRPVITNTSEERNGGNGVVLSKDSRIEGIEIRDTHASGVFGRDVGAVALSDVSIHGANRSRGLIVENPLAPLPHAGVALMASPESGSQTARLSRVHVVEAAGMAIGANALAGARLTLDLYDVEVIGGAGFGNADYGIAATANGRGSEASLQMTRSRVRGRTSPGARNVVLAASDHGTVKGLIYESFIGESGQDGVLAAALTLPATIDVSIVGSTIENGAQSNVEGTFLAFPHEPNDVADSSIAISIHRSTIRGAGQGPLFGERGSNVLLTGSFIPEGQPLVAAPYSLRITDSTIEDGSAFGLAVGSFKGLPTADPGHFDVLVRNTKFIGNRGGEIMIGAPEARLDARGNCWRSPDDESEPRVITYWVEEPAAAETSERVSCE
ncbi:hypothetical protein [Wenzhouxiangella limi]|uniref:Right handed beta helix domain-containing protein n=1 Tax=Wenzhouxiangella limi TaxID=2707351 RepID=A0A845V1I2_9GAMM|nr:hypothetical protein [Wenzhouxiangella limi]NDY94141.1 hypothetical protein [Wenzhouxiangella limi]